VPRLIPVLVGLVALITAVPSSALPGSGKIAYARDGGGIVTLDSDGTNVLLRQGLAESPRWSPDGSRLAFTEYTGTPGAFRLLVMNADGSGEHVVATTGAITLSNQPWSPDGTRIAWGPFSEGDVYTASAAGGGLRQISHDGFRKGPPSWSPAGSLLVYASSVIPGPSIDHWELFVARDDGSAPVQITSGGSGTIVNDKPSWSPSGGSIAFVRRVGTTQPAIYVIHPDGTELHRVAEISRNSTGDPAWSPDGSKIAYADAVNGGYTRLGPAGQEIFLVDADGSGRQRLTELAPSLTTDSTPIWSPDGDRILFRRQSLMTMNPDGTCEGALVTVPSFTVPSWQPVPGGPPVGEKTCRAIAVTAAGAPGRNLSTISILGAVTNEGTEPLTNVVVTISAPRHDLSLAAFTGYGCRRRSGNVVCVIDRIGRGETRNVVTVGYARRVGRDQRGLDVALLARLTVTADGPLLPTARETAVVRFTSGKCSSRDRGRGRIDGTHFPDRICGRRGRDDIHPLGGKDVVDAGAGNDLIYTNDLNGDIVNCGPGRDRVIVDKKDEVAGNCERIIHSRFPINP
jgi:Tol biopolymer transport system component